MTGISPEFAAHLKSGLTTLCWCWKVTRRDGKILGFTDHDQNLRIQDTEYRADTGLTAQTLSQGTGLAVDNTEAIGALNSSAISEADILAGRFDGARAEAWLVNWENVDQRTKLFQGWLGEIVRRDGEFHAELRGLSEALNQPQGRIYQKPCSAVLGDNFCQFDLNTQGYYFETEAQIIEEKRIFRFSSLIDFTDRWFENGRLNVLSGHAAGLSGLIKNDQLTNDDRTLELWDSIRANILPGDTVRIEAGCDKRAATCKLKFNNFLNFGGFPDIPGEDWLISYPTRSGQNSSGSLRR